MKSTALVLVAALLLGSGCGSPATSAEATPTPSASASPVASASLTPTDFALPPGCSYVGKGEVDLAISTLMTWRVDCAAAPDFQFVEKLTPVFAQQGWTVCFIVGGRGVWAKGATQTFVSQSAVGYPTLSQLPRQTQDCPLPTAYVNSLYKFSLSLPVPYRKSVSLSSVRAGQERPAAEDAFTVRTDGDEAAIGTIGCHTACPTWNYVAYVTVNTGTGAETPRQYYASQGGTVGQVIEDTTVDGRPAIRVTNGARYPMQLIVKDSDRIVVVAYQIYPPANGISFPAGASKEKLDQIIASFRFVP
jgi:hypothetical protein